MGVCFAEGRTVQRPQHTGQSGRRQAGSGPEPREDVAASSPSCGAHGTRPGRWGDQTRSICPARSPATPGAPSVTADGAPTCTVRALGLSARTQEQKELGFRLPDALTCRGLKRCCRFPLFQGALLCSRPDPRRAALPTGGPCRRRPRSRLPLLSVFRVFHVRFGLKTPCLKHSVDPFTLNWAASAIARPDAAHLGAGTRTGQHCARPSNQQSPPRSTERPKPGHARHCKSTSPAARWAGTRSRASRNCTCFQGLGRRHAWWLGLRRSAGEQATSQVQKRPATGTDSYNNVMGGPPLHACQGHQDNKRTDKPRTEGAGLFPAASNAAATLLVRVESSRPSQAHPAPHRAPSRHRCLTISVLPPLDASIVDRESASWGSLPFPAAAPFQSRFLLGGTVPHRPYFGAPHKLLGFFSAGFLG